MGITRLAAVVAVAAVLGSAAGARIRRREDPLLRELQKLETEVPVEELSGASDGVARGDEDARPAADGGEDKEARQPKLGQPRWRNLVSEESNTCVPAPPRRSASPRSARRTRTHSSPLPPQRPLADARPPCRGRPGGGRAREAVGPSQPSRRSGGREASAPGGGGDHREPEADALPLPHGRAPPLGAAGPRCVGEPRSA